MPVCSVGLAAIVNNVLWLGIGCCASIVVMLGLGLLYANMPSGTEDSARQFERKTHAFQ